MGDNIVKIELTVDEVNFILSTLSEKPYKDVFRLIAKIQEQGNEQILSDQKKMSNPFYKELPGQDTNPV